MIEMEDLTPADAFTHSSKAFQNYQWWCPQHVQIISFHADARSKDRLPKIQLVFQLSNSFNIEKTKKKKIESKNLRFRKKVSFWQRCDERSSYWNFRVAKKNRFNCVIFWRVISIIIRNFDNEPLFVGNWVNTKIIF